MPSSRTSHQFSGERAALAVDAGRTPLLDRDEMIAAANSAGIAVAAYGRKNSGAIWECQASC